MIEIITRSDSAISCRPVGDLDVAGAIQLRNVIDDLACPGVDLEIDLRLVRGTDAFGISALIGAIRMLRSLGGTVTLLHASPTVRWFVDRLAERGPIADDPVGPSDAA
jgi:anti-anti-sigma factor